MNIDEIKNEMREFRDFYGGDLLNIDDLDGAQSIEELKVILNNHEKHIDMMLRDACSPLDSFKMKNWS